MSYAGYKGFRSRYPIKLLYVSNLPVIFASALFANVYFFAQLLWNSVGRPAPGTNLLFRIIGDFNVTTSTALDSQHNVSPVGGLAYYVTAPHNIQQVAARPVASSRLLGHCRGLLRRLLADLA